jgi:hypothetical protein
MPGARFISGKTVRRVFALEDAGREKRLPAIEIIAAEKLFCTSQQKLDTCKKEIGQYAATRCTNPPPSLTEP